MWIVVVVMNKEWDDLRLKNDKIKQTTMTANSVKEEQRWNDCIFIHCKIEYNEGSVHCAHYIEKVD